MMKRLLLAGAFALATLPAIAQQAPIDPKTPMVLEVTVGELQGLLRALDSHVRNLGLPSVYEVALLRQKLERAQPKAPPAPAGQTD